MLRKIEEETINLGAFRARVIETSRVVFESTFRKMCEKNACGMYHKCYMCPPDVGDVDTLISQALSYPYALIYQTVTPLEDSFDIDGMEEGKRTHNRLTFSLRPLFGKLGLTNALHLGAGACGVCDICAKVTDEPCRFPERATPSLEAYGVNVYETSKAAEMKYINGQNTVTYFGAVFFRL